MANINSVITYNANLSPAQAQIKALTGQIAGLTAAFNTLNKTATAAQRRLATAFTGDVGNIGGFTAQMVSAHNAVESFGKQLATNRLTMREYFREAIVGYTKQNSLMQQLAERQVRYQQSVAVPTGGGQMMMLTPQTLAATGTSAGLAAERFSIFNKLVDGGATSMLNWGKNTQWAGRQLMVGFTVPLAMFTALASKQFRELDKELTRFQKVYGSDLGGAVSEATDRMRENVKQLAFDISRTYGIAAKDTAALAADIAATGQEGQALLESVQQTTRLAVLGEVDRQEAMKATLSLQSAFRLNTNELAESINFLNAVENQTSATLEDLATAIPKVGPIVRSLGGDVRDLATLLVAMREGGIPAAEAANALKSGLAALINPTKQASEVAKKFGVDLVGIVDANRGQLMPTLYEFQNALSNLDSFSRSRIIEQIFGKYQFARISALFDNLGRLGSQTQAVVELASKSSAELAATANQEIRILTESTAVKFQRTLEELKNAIIPIGQTLTETLIPILSFIGEGIKTFSGFFQSLPGPIKDFAKLGVAIAALAGPVIMLVGLFGNLIANGIKFGMMVTRLGARMMGLKVQPFELLNAELMAAKFSVDNLTTAFTNQETAMNRLVGVMTRYADSLVRLRAASPELFVPGVLPTTGGRTPVRRQKGGPIPGYGGGDIVPAYLEPGEFVITKEATRNNRAFLEAINSGKTPKKYKDGKDSAAGSGQADPNKWARTHTESPESFGIRARESGITREKGAIAILNYGGMTATMFPHYLNNTFDKLQNKKINGWKSWMTPGIPFNRESAIEMKKVLQTEMKNRIFEGKQPSTEQRKSLTYLNGLINSPNKKWPYQRALMGYAMNTAASERWAGIIPDTDSAQIMREQQLYDELKKQTGRMKKPETLFKFFTELPIKYMKELQSGVVPFSNNEKLYVKPKQMIYSGKTPTSAKDSAKYFAPKYSQPKYLHTRWGRIRIAQEGGVGTGEPALLEPGEFIVNSEASKKYANILHGMNKGTIKGYQFGRSQNLPGETTLPSGLVIPGSAAPAAAGGAGETVKAHLNRPITVPASSLLGLQGLSDSARASLLAITANGDVLVRVFSNLVVALQKTTNSALNTGSAMASTVSAELKSAAAWEVITRNTGLTMQDLQPTILRVTAELDNLGNELIDDPRLYQIVETELTQLAAAGDRAAIVLQTLGSQYGAMADPNDPRKHRMDLGAGIAPSYRTGRTGTGTPVHMLPYVDLRQYAVDPVTGARRALPMAAAETTGPNRAMQDPMAKMMRGQGLMNVAFMGSMLVSTFAMAGAASEDLAAKLSMLSMAIMALPMLQMLNPKGMATNFLGLGSLGKTLAAKGAAKQAAVAGAAPIGTRFVPNAAQAIAAGGPKFLPFGSTAGSGLLAAGRIASLAGGPVGIGVATAITGVVAAYMLYKNAADEARERAIASFEDPAKSAEYFGESIDDLAKELEDRKLRFSPLADLSGVDQGLRDVVKEEYAPLIERVKYATASDGARQLALAYNNMIINGLSAENAKETLRAIAVEAGTQGGQAYGEAFVSGMAGAENVEDAIQKQLDLLNPEKNKQLIERLQQSIPQLESQAFDAMNADAASRWKQLGIGFAQLGGIDWQKQTSGLTDFQGKFEVMTRGLTNVWEGFTGQLFDSTPEARAADAAANMVEQTEDSINDLKQLSADAFAASTEEFMKAYEDTPELVIKAIQTTSVWLDASAENVDLLKQKLMELNPILAGLIAMLQNPEEISLFYQLMTVGADPTRFFDENGFNKAAAEQTVATIAHYDQLRKNSEETFGELKENTIKFIDEEIKATNKGIRKVNDYWDSWAKVTRKEQRQAQKDYDQAQRRSEKFIEAKQDEIEAIQDGIDERRDEFEERMQGYEDERKAIEDSSDAYIKSLQKNQQADSFYAQQRKTSLSALQKLASGDVFGYLEERNQMSADAQQFSYDQMISGIEDRRDAELKLVEDTMEKERRRQDEWEEAQSEKIEGINDLIDAENELMDERTKNHEKEMRQFEKRQKTIEINRRQDLKDDKEKLRRLQTAREDAETLELADYEKMTELLGKAYEDRYAKQITELQKTQYYIRLNDLLERNASTEVSKRLSETQLKIAAFTQAFGQKPRAKVSIDEQLAAMGMFPYGPGQGGQPAPTGATGGYVNNGTIQRLNDGGGGKVTGPGGPKSDVIPALLSNGEYVVRASSVKQYGKDMMDNINEGKFASGGIVGYKNGTGSPTWYSADRAEQNITGTRYASKYTYTPGWSPGQYNLPPQRYGPYGTGRIPGTTTPFVDPQKGRTADLATMLSHGYSHKMIAYGTSDDYKNFLANKANQGAGGKKWQSIVSSMSAPSGVGAAVSESLQSLVRGIPNIDYWRTLSREQKKFILSYTSGNLNNWSNQKVFRLMPFIPATPAIPTSRLNPAEDQYRPSFKTSRLWANMDPVSYPIPWPLSMPEDYLEDKNPYPLYPGRPGGNVGNDIPPPPPAQQVWERFMSWITSGSAPKLMPMPGRGAGWMGPYSYANGGIVGYKNGTSNPTWYSADRAEQNATGTRYTRPAPSVTPTPNWNPAQYRLPEQRYGPYGVGRIPQTTKPFVAPQIGRTADLATMLSHGYSHKMNAYGTTLDYQQFLMNKSGATYVPGYGYVGQKIEGGRKWQSLMESMLVPGGIGSAVSDRLQPLLRDMPNLDFWRSLSREQKKFVFNYSTMGKLNNWTNEKVFRLMPWLAPNENTPKLFTGPRFGVPEKQYLALPSYPTPVTIGRDSTSPAYGLPVDEAPYGYIPGTNVPVPGPRISPYPLGWDTQTSIATQTPPGNNGTNYVLSPDGKSYVPLSDVRTGTAAAGFGLIKTGVSTSIEQKGLLPTIGGMAKHIIQNPLDLVPFVASSKIDTSTQEGKDLLAASLLLDFLSVIPFGYGAVAAGRAATKTVGRDIYTATSLVTKAKNASEGKTGFVTNSAGVTTAAESMNAGRTFAVDKSGVATILQPRTSFRTPAFDKINSSFKSIKAGNILNSILGLKNPARAVQQSKIISDISSQIHRSNSLKGDFPELLDPNIVQPQLGSRLGRGLYTSNDFTKVSQQTKRTYNERKGPGILSKKGSPQYRLNLTPEAWEKTMGGKGYIDWQNEFIPGWLEYNNLTGKVSPKRAAYDLQEFLGKSGLNDPYLQSLIEQGYIGAVDKSSATFVNWLPGIKDSGWGLAKMAEGGLIRKFGSGGGTPDSQEGYSYTNPSQNQGGSPITRAYEAKEAGSGVAGGHHEYAYSQNGWPYLPGYTAGELQQGIIPGTSVSISTHKDVLPLFLALGSLYNSKIRKIDQSQTAGFGFRNNQTNHRSGTALDINWSEEGALSDATHLYDWWSGKSNPAAPWSRISSNPARTAVEIRNWFNQFGEIIEWYGSSRLGGDLIAGQGISADWMHWQISQRTKPSPDRVKEVMARLGITAEGGMDGTPTTETTPTTGELVEERKADAEVPPVRGLTGIFSLLPAEQQNENGQTDGITQTTPSTETVGAGSGGAWLKQLILSKGVPDTVARTLWAIGMRESGADPAKTYPQGRTYDWNSSGAPYFDTGLFQINNRHLSRVKSTFGESANMQDMLDYEKNWIIMKQLSSDFTRWNDWGIATDMVSSDWTGWPATSWSKEESFRNYMYYRNQYGNYAAGGFISGPGGPRSDIIPAMLSNGEYVVKAASVQKYGKGFMDRLNAGSVDFSNAKQFSGGGIASLSPKLYMAGGGMVGSMPTFSMPQVSSPSTATLSSNVNNNIGGSNVSSSNTSNKINIVINGAGGKSANAIANKVISMINDANQRRDHSRSLV